MILDDLNDKAIERETALGGTKLTNGMHGVNEGIALQSSSSQAQNS